MRAVGRIDLDHLETVSQGLNALVAQLRERYAIDAVYVFGSYARGEVSEGSDIDLLVIGDVPGRFHERIGQVLKLTRLPVEPLVYTVEEFRRLQAEGHPLIARALTEGQRLLPDNEASEAPVAKQPISAQEREALQWLKEHLHRALGNRVTSLRLFGSRARGEGHPASDLDVALIVDRDDDHAEDVAWDAMVEIMARYDIICEIIVFDEADYTQSLARQEPLLLNIEAEGLAL